jgi:Uma2 family endonuclease
MTIAQIITLPDHTQLPESDGTFVKNFQEHPQRIVLTSSIQPILQQLHPDGNYAIGQDSGIYWRLTEPLEKGAESPDWFYVPNVTPLLEGTYRRSYVLWKEIVAPLIAIEFVSGDGSEERDRTPPVNSRASEEFKDNKVGKFWVYEQAIRIPFYAIYEVKKASVEVYHLVDGSYELMPANDRGHYPIAPMGVELGIWIGQIDNVELPWLRWWDSQGNLLLTGNERAIAESQLKEEANVAKVQAQLIATQEREQRLEVQQKLDRISAYLRSQGIDPDNL